MKNVLLKDLDEASRTQDSEPVAEAREHTLCRCRAAAIQVSRSINNGTPVRSFLSLASVLLSLCSQHPFPECARRGHNADS